MSSVEALATRVRVSVLTAGRRTDLAVPAGLPVAELAPALARACGLPEGSLGSGLTVAHADGRLLDPALDLDRAGVVDGDLLVLEAPAAIELPDDDLAAAVARVRGAVLTAEDGVRAAALAVPVLAGAAALALTRWRGGALVAAGLGVTAVALLVAVRALGRRRVAGSGEVVAGLGVAAVLVAALAGAVAAEGMPFRALAAATAAALAGLVAAGLSPRHRTVLATWGVGLVLLVGATAAGALGAPPDTVAAGLLVCTLLGAPAAPRVALAASGLGVRAAAAAWAEAGLGAAAVPQRGADPQRRAEASRSDRSREGVAAAVGHARSALLGVIAAAVTLVLAGIPALCADGPTGTALAALGAVGLALRVRRVPTRSAALTAVAGATAAAGVLGVLGDPRVGAGVLALGLLAAGRWAVRPGPVTPGAARALDFLDTLVQVAALPLAVLVAL
ncbi:MAG TPA: EsaB/YukD family protein [Dermatophilaceae bacterium]|nr:EsaB/YukD family protein [Dermatophilaceae bacterium]